MARLLLGRQFTFAGLLVFACGLLCGTRFVRADEWKPAAGPLTSPWTGDVSPEKVWPEYPRPQMVRAEWQNLNGLWEYSVRPRDASRPDVFDGRILVPFAIETALSGVARSVQPDQRLWYRRRFAVEGADPDKRVLLHFGGVDWESTVWVNGVEVGTHRGGYDPFVLDVTDAIRKQNGQEHEVVVSVWDPTDQGTQPRGKQVLEPKGIWYTAVTGIWQTVWLEVVPDAHIESLRIVPDVEGGCVEVTARVHHVRQGQSIEVHADVEGKQVSVAGRPGEPLRLAVPGARLWSPGEPVLYDMTLRLVEGNTAVDSLRSYFGMRRISTGLDAQGTTRMLLNGEPLFQYGPLDQGWWPDGLYTAPTDEALRFDIETMKMLGFNMVRKHVKVEPARWYYHCDRLGLVVWQDMPSGDQHAPWGSRGEHDGKEIVRSEESAAQYRTELRAMIESLANHPSIVCWVPFNEGWGQFDTAGVARSVKSLDPSRLVNCASGGNDFPVGDVLDVHRYPGPAVPPDDPARAAVLGEFGGLGLPIEDHLWRTEKNWGYRQFASRNELFSAYEKLIEELNPLVTSRLSAAVYTQITDVEIEVNGLMTYDRRVLKVDARRFAELSRSLPDGKRVAVRAEKPHAKTPHAKTQKRKE